MGNKRKGKERQVINVEENQEEFLQVIMLKNKMQKKIKKIKI